MVTPESLLRFLVFQLALYGLPLGLLIYATRNYRANPGQARVLIAIAIAPFAYYAYCLFAGRIAQPLLRDWEVAAWPRKTITRVPNQTSASICTGAICTRTSAIW